MRNFSHIVTFEWKNKVEINRLVEQKTIDISTATEHISAILRGKNSFIGTIDIPNKEKLLNTLVQAEAEFSAHLQLDKYFYFLENSIKYDIDEQEDLSEKYSSFRETHIIEIL